MKERVNRKDKGIPLFLSIILVFCVLGTVVFSVSRRISGEMSASAIHNLNESLNLIKGTIESVLRQEAEFQTLLAGEIAAAADPETFVYSLSSSQTMVKISLIPSGQTEGISNTGDLFTAEELDFSGQRSVEGLEISQSYINSMGTWAYTMRCPVVKDGEEIASLYIEYIYESLAGSLPDRFYNGSAMLYLMDSKSERFVLKPTGMGERNAGHLNLEDFYRANSILEEETQTAVSDSVRSGKNLMFYHDIQRKASLIYMWSVNDGATYLIGYVPIEAIQQEGKAVNQNIFIVVVVMLAAFLICCALYYFNNRQQNQIRKEREAEREVHNRQLAEALRAAQAASNSKTTFLSNMSHDIRTPMNAILGFTTLLEKDADNSFKVREYTKKISASGRHLLSLINDVLDVSKIESGKMILTIGEFTLNDLVSSVDTIIRPMAAAKNQDFQIQVTGIRHEYLTGDEMRLNQILINLLSNAVKYTQEGGNIWFRITGLGKRSSQFEHIRIEVEDNGYGMTPEYLETIFEAFTRAENSTTNKVQGTGLGMAITKNIVELMGGTIDVSSKVGEGSLFRVELELRIPDGRSDEQFWEENHISRILAVDDDEEVLKSIQMLMKETKVQVDTASGGREALRMVQEAHEGGHDYQIILLDWRMPDMDGSGTAEKIRSLLPDPVPIFFLTCYDGDEVQEKAFRIGSADILSKPFFVSALKEAVSRMGEEQKQETGSASEAELAGRLKGLKLLVAEDNEINAEILSELLELEEISCEIMENGQLVVERFQNAGPDEFDAILMDVQMPVMNGYDATKAIRALERKDAGEIPIIAMTANAFAEDVKDALDAGMNAHVAKPIDMELLKRTLNEYVRKSNCSASYTERGIRV